MAYISKDRRTGNICVRAYAGINPITGKPCTVNKTVRADASRDEIAAAVREVEDRAAVSRGDPAMMTIASALSWYLDRWDKSPRTLDLYRSYARRHVCPRIGNVRMAKADARVFSRFFHDLARPKDEGGAGLSASSVLRIRAMLSGCFTRLLADGEIDHNPVTDVRVGKPDQAEARPLTEDDLAKLVGYLSDAMDDPAADDAGFERESLACLLWTCLHTGCRRAELAGFQVGHWRTLVRAGREVRGLRVERTLVEVSGNGGEPVAKGPKSKNGRRFITLEASAAARLDDHLATQARVLASAGIAQDDKTPLFARADGSPWRPWQLSEEFAGIVRELGLAPGTHLHTLRHTHATYLLQRGEPMKTVQKRLGHGSISTTLDTYGHCLPGDDERLSEAIDGILGEMSRRVHGGASAPRVPTCPRTGEPCARFAPSQSLAHCDGERGKEGTGNADG